MLKSTHTEYKVYFWILGDIVIRHISVCHHGVFHLIMRSFTSTFNILQIKDEKMQPVSLVPVVVCHVIYPSLKPSQSILGITPDGNNCRKKNVHDIENVLCCRNRGHFCFAGRDWGLILHHAAHSDRTQHAVTELKKRREKKNQNWTQQLLSLCVKLTSVWVPLV